MLEKISIKKKKGKKIQENIENKLTHEYYRF